MNPFRFASAAQRYRDGRPAFHPLVMKMVKETLGLHVPVKRALDVACGTGLSTRALRDVAQRVDGVDQSIEMLREAAACDGVTYHRGDAEQLPFGDELFDLVTVASGFHWFDRNPFLREISRVLKPGGHVVIYE